MSVDAVGKKKATLLLVEDEEKLAKILADYLRFNGYEIIYALDGYRGMELFYDKCMKLI